MDALPSDSREPLGRTLKKHVLPLIAGRLKTLWTKSTKVVLVVNEPDDLPLSIVGRPSRETFPGNRIQSPKVFRTIEDKKCDRQGSLSTQGSNKYPESKKAREMDSSPIQENVSDSNKESKGQELERTIELDVGITPDDPRAATSHATAIAIALNQPVNSYWIQTAEELGTHIEFINNRWYSIFWSKSFNSYYTEKDQYDRESGSLGLRSLARLLQTQEIKRRK